MTNEQKVSDEVAQWLIVKRGLYYRPKSEGYTGLRCEAGMYSHAEAKSHCYGMEGEVTMVRLDEAPEFSAKCWPEVRTNELQRQVNSLRSELQSRRAAPPEAHSEVGDAYGTIWVKRTQFAVQSAYAVKPPDEYLVGHVAYVPALVPEAGAVEANLPKTHGGCTCLCHRTPGVLHFTACCSPSDEATPLMTKEWFERKVKLEGDTDIGAGAVEAVPVASAALLDLLRRARLMTGVMEGLSGCRGDDEWIWALQRDLDAALNPTPSVGKTGEATHRHKKRGTEYLLIGFGKMQAEHWMEHYASNQFPVDMRDVAIYRSVSDPTEIWVRPREEFEDGRFESLSGKTGGG